MKRLGIARGGGRGIERPSSSSAQNAVQFVVLPSHLQLVRLPMCGAKVPLIDVYDDVDGTSWTDCHLQPPGDSFLKAADGNLPLIIYIEFNLCSFYTSR